MASSIDRRVESDTADIVEVIQSLAQHLNTLGPDPEPNRILLQQLKQVMADNRVQISSHHPAQKPEFRLNDCGDSGCFDAWAKP